MCDLIFPDIFLFKEIADALSDGILHVRCLRIKHYKCNQFNLINKVLETGIFKMKTININLALIAIQVLSIDEETKLATINFAYAQPRKDGKAKKWVQLDLEEIFITGRIAKKLNDPANMDYEFGKTYVSSNLSKDMKENPFCLMRKHAVDQDGNSYVNFYLKGVEERGSYLVPLTMPNGDKVVSRIWKDNNFPYQYARYIDVYDKQKAWYDNHPKQNVVKA